MKNLMVLITLIFASQSTTLAEKFIINHGPYLQNMSPHGVCIYFTTSEKSFSRIEVTCDKWTEIKTFYATEDGLYHAYTHRHAIYIDGLDADTKYKYRIISKEMKTFEPYSITYGDSIASPWESFKTFSNTTDSCSFVIINDGHDDVAKIETLLRKSQLSTADIVFYLGDMVSYIEEEDTPYDGFIDISTDIFAKNIPFTAIRGNHETRGNMARNYREYVGCPNNKFYGISYIGNTAIIILDSGEDKPDNHREYGGITDFDKYRHQQATWLAQEVKSKRFRKTENRIVLMHIPPVLTGETPEIENHGVLQLNALFMPIFRKAGIDMIFSGHTHQHYVIEKNISNNPCPIIINDNKSVVDVSITTKGIYVKITRMTGEVVIERTF